MLYLGIDPGLQRTGYALVAAGASAFELRLVEAGIFKFKSSDTLQHRLAQLSEDLASILDEHKPQAAAVEDLFSHYAHPRTAILMGHARGVVLLELEKRHIPITAFAPREVKLALCGSGAAGKAQIQRAVQAQFKLAQLPDPPDVADAIAIAATLARRTGLEGMG